MANREIMEDRDTCSHHCKGIEVPTDDEVAVLNAMRALKDRVKGLKKKISEIRSSGNGHQGEELSGLENMLAQLKVEWNGLDKKREEAARERMIILGHEET